MSHVGILIRIRLESIFKDIMYSYKFLIKIPGKIRFLSYSEKRDPYNFNPGKPNPKNL